MQPDEGAAASRFDYIRSHSGDFSFCQKLCEQVMDGMAGRGWDVCVREFKRAFGPRKLLIFCCFAHSIVPQVNDASRPGGVRNAQFTDIL